MEYTFTKEEIQVIQDTFKKVQFTDCWKLLYDKLFELDPDSAKLFKGDIGEQQHRIMNMMKTVSEGLNNPNIILPAIQDLGKRHAHYGVDEKQYETFKASLFHALKTITGNEWNEQTEKIWDKFYQILVSVMNSNVYKG
jgi:hemoglobin-like flavoprotein